VIAFTRESAEELEQAVGKLQTLGVQTDILPRFFSSLGPDVRITTIEGVQLVGVPPVRLSGGALAAKRAFDAVVALASLVVLSPLLVGLALWVRRDSPGPVLFRQTRLGLGQRPFTCLKFRTMAADTSSDEHRAYVRRAMDRDTLPEEHGLYKLERPSVVTRSGRFLRRTSLDELPQLFNVLRGEMSLVGPRPCIPYETELFQPHHFERFTVPAGITGLWQVKARAHATFGEALDMDVAYARGWSFGLDLLLLLETPLHLLRRRSTK
jgi:lipopolysaccharide/colanic/teichoic acid biosynthesis glycosyltransferase